MGWFWRDAFGMQEPPALAVYQGRRSAIPELELKAGLFAQIGFRHFG